MCGLTLRSSGLPPRVRAYRSFFGSTPACAGLPVCCEVVRFCKTAYPRVCGLTILEYAHSCNEMGLPPRVRAYPSCAIDKEAGTGSTPACAGLPEAVSRNPPIVRVYPRVCGLTSWVCHQTLLAIGLPPRVRAYHERELAIVENVGSTPACAGLPREWLSRTGPSPVYPRVCGLTSRSMSTRKLSRGLPPRVRAYRILAGPPPAREWSTPACAGLPVRRWRNLSQSKVYPRVCGLTRANAPHPSSLYGLPPRVRAYPLLHDSPYWIY